MNKKIVLAAAIGSLALAFSDSASTQETLSGDAGTLVESVGKKLFPVKQPYSPYAGRRFPTRPLFGDTHLHSSLSMDAGMTGTTVGPEDAYRFAKGEEVVSSTGQRVRLSRPLDFMAVTDHSDNMGLATDFLGGKPEILADPTARRWYDMIQQGGQEAVKVAVEIIQGLTEGTMPEALRMLPGTDGFRSAWEEAVTAAEKYNEPGQYTAFHGYEWTSTTGGYNLHRVVIYRDGGAQAIQLEPYTTVAPLGSDNPRPLGTVAFERNETVRNYSLDAVAQGD